MTSTTRVVVLGAGYAGVHAANRLTQREDVTVTLINPYPVFIERIRLHQLAAGTGGAEVTLRDVLAPAVRLRIDTATTINAPDRTLTLASGETMPYDYLVYAVGSTSATLDVPGAADYAYPIASLDEAQRLRAALEATGPTAPVVVVGGGPTGIETATELAEAGRAVTLVCGRELGPSLHRKGRAHVARELTRLGVTVISGTSATVQTAARDAVVLSDGRKLPSAVTIWTAGFAVPGLARRSNLSTDNLGRLLTDETLTSIDDPRIIAAGDAAAPSGVPYRMSCQAAGPLGAHAADTVLRRRTGAEPEEFSLRFVGQCLSLGRSAGIIQLARAGDEAIALHIGGRAGARLKEYVCRATIDQLRKEATTPGSRRWVGDGSRAAQLAAASGAPSGPRRTINR
ncbi:FAD-dependent oxidoreductase [Ruania alkalisoli]|uniref:FAD-dependent oxidoreductase n=1 Tax=Ruania alkalisoli TaxID=2779775 RepID=A0A7M1SVD7_9MICO|nr:FAD-dependent oxidoreductase [Ruania alkalisoli]QOR70722.1 FAD-dependent oxidoreductase [Ruania alkalisoli]